ncbi:S8 family serine peptidase [bacterium]|nr:S8 family serine peptidase [bacterium]
MRARLAMAILIALLAASCGGGMGASPVMDGPDGEIRLAGESGGFEGWQQWQQILEDPGIAGVDYDPQGITVNYRSDASFELSGSFAPPPGHRAADFPNAMLRQDSRYEQVTDHISGRFGIPIEQQVYAHGVLMASFRLPLLVDGEQLIESIRSEYPLQVEDVSFSRLISPALNPNDRFFVLSDNDGGWQWGMYRCGVPAAWERSTGDPQLLVGVVDSGCWRGHEEIGSGVIDPQLAFPQASCDLLDNDTDVNDTDGHGTAVCSVIAANTGNLSGLAAVLPGSRVLPLRVGSGSATTHARVVAGCMLAAELGCRIVNLSWSSATPSHQLSLMAQALDSQGVLLVAAAGNSGTDAARWPAAHSLACGVAASDAQDVLADDSSFGDWCDISAPGSGFSVPDIRRDNLYIDNASGSSLSAALASGCFGLMLSISHGLDPGSLRSLVSGSALPLNGGGPPRLDLPAAMLAMDQPQISLEAPASLLQQDFLTLQPTLSGSFRAVELWIDGEYVMSRSEAPWQLMADLRELPAGRHSLELRAVASSGSQYASAGFEFLHQAPAVAMPWSAGFETADAARTYSLDIGGYRRELLDGLATVAGMQPAVEYTNAGGLGWQSKATDAWQGERVNRLAWDGGQDTARMLAQVSEPVRLVGYELPTLSLTLRQQLGSASAALLLSADGGSSWQALEEVNGLPGLLSGDSSGWQLRRYDLAAHAGQTVQLLLLVQIDAGEQSSGQYIEIDALGIATGFQPSLPVAAGVSLDSAVIGSVAGRSFLKAQLTGAKDVQKAVYWLDCEPYNVQGPEDSLTEAVIGSSLPGVLGLPAVDGNRHAVLRVDYFDANGSQGPRLELPVWIFNRRGDANADGVVDLLDLQAYAGHYGARQGEAGYEPFMDSDMDGVVTELDSSAVAYNLD